MAARQGKHLFEDKAAAEDDLTWLLDGDARPPWLPSGNGSSSGNIALTDIFGKCRANDLTEIELSYDLH